MDGTRLPVGVWLLYLSDWCMRLIIIFDIWEAKSPHFIQNYHGLLKLFTVENFKHTQDYAKYFFFFFFFFIFGCAGSSVRARAFSSCGKWGPLFIAVRGPLFIAVRGPPTIAAPPAAGHRLPTRRLSSCGSRA